jgi:hypothetical protein
VHKLFSRGARAEGELTRLTIVRDRGRFEYEYRVGTDSFSTWCPVHKSKQVMAYRRGDALTVLYDPKNPKRSIVGNLFEKVEKGA